MKNVMLKIAKTLKNTITTNVGYKILALVFAFILWLVVVNVQNPASTRTFTNIPVSIINEESVLDGDHVYTIKSGDTATITVSGTRTVLAALSASDFVATADFASLSITNAAPISVTLTSDMSRYTNQIDINVKTKSMVIEIEDLVAKTIPVEVAFTGKKPDDLQIDEITMNPEELTVYVPQSKEDIVAKAIITVDYADIVPGEVMTLESKIVDYNGKEITMDNGVEISSESVDVAFETYEEKEVSVKVEYFGTPADGYSVSGVTISKQTVKVKGPADVLKDLTAIEIPKSQINISNKTTDVSEVVELKDYLPSDVTFADDENVEITVTVHIKQNESEN